MSPEELKEEKERIRVKDERKADKEFEKNLKIKK